MTATAPPASASSARIGLFGAGTIGEALLAGLISSGHSPRDLLVVEPVAERAAALVERYGVSVASGDEAAGCDVLLLAVKPQDMPALLADVGGAVTPGQVVVSMAAGLPCAWFERRLPDGVPVVRVMTNTPLLVGRAMSVICAGTTAGPEHLDLAESLVAPVGAVLRLAEDKLDAVTALSGSGPAWVCYLVESMIDAGVLLGLPRDVARELTVQTLVGTGALLTETGEHPVVLRDRVSSPGGSTIRGTAELESSGVRAGILAGIRAAHDRNVELGAALR